MHVTHLDDQIIATRGVLGSAIPARGVAKPRPYDWRVWQRDLSNGITQQTPRGRRPDPGQRLPHSFGGRRVEGLQEGPECGRRVWGIDHCGVWQQRPGVGIGDPPGRSRK